MSNIIAAFLCTVSAALLAAVFIDDPNPAWAGLLVLNVLLYGLNIAVYVRRP